MEDQTRREEIALFRYQIIAEVVTEPSGHRRQLLMAQIAKRQLDIPYSSRIRIGLRTLQRWVKDYQNQGLKGLEPQERCDAGLGYAITPEIVEAAGQLRRAVPERSVRTLIELLEMSRQVPRGVLKRSTLAEALTRAGHTRQALKPKTAAYQRFQEPHRNRSWQGVMRSYVSNARSLKEFRPWSFTRCRCNGPALALVSGVLQVHQ